jgi:hypothetical protein
MEVLWYLVRHTLLSNELKPGVVGPGTKIGNKILNLIDRVAGEVAGTASLVSTCCVYSSHGQSRGRQPLLIGSNPAAANPSAQDNSVASSMMDLRAATATSKATATRSRIVLRA